MNITLRKALFTSALIHFIAITPIYSLDLSRDAIDQKKPMVVDYVTVKEMPDIEMPKSNVQNRLQETNKLELTKDVSAKDKKRAETSPKRRRLAKGDAKKTPLQDAAKAKAAPDDIAKQESQIKSTKEYIGYYQIIREKIRTRLKESYRYYYREGDVYLTFTLRRDGSLLGYNVVRPKSVNDETLAHIATVSLIEAAPFPSFPKAFSRPDMSFNLAVSFKKR